MPDGILGLQHPLAHELIGDRVVLGQPEHLGSTQQVRTAVAHMAQEGAPLDAHHGHPGRRHPRQPVVVLRAPIHITGRTGERLVEQREHELALLAVDLPAVVDPVLHGQRTPEHVVAEGLARDVTVQAPPDTVRHHEDADDVPLGGGALAPLHGVAVLIL